ncbi:hypothetical protein MRB53_011806 [Persea americana]|uniref:Uncharacterized protein n=1 Tax=Persea americana TaxID=3435 RepID=A0ACC2LVU4_PERAE|nr:hypothetical protein MRB53_011806 [Persea americana]
MHILSNLGYSLTSSVMVDHYLYPILWYIEEDDLLRFLEKEEVQSIPLFHGTVENRKIKKKYFRNWVHQGHWTC